MNEVNDFQDVIDEILGPSSELALVDLIRRGEYRQACEEILHLGPAPQTRLSKNEAISVGNADILRLLLEKDNYINDTMVAAACEKKDRMCMRVLLDFGWPIDQHVHFAASALSLAVDDVPFMRFLLHCGANVNARSTLDESALSTAIACSCMNSIRFLLSEGTEVTHGNLLHYAVERESQSESAGLIEELVRRGADVNAYKYDNPRAFRFCGLRKLPTPLHIACRKGNVPAAKALLRFGANPHLQMLEAGIPVPPTAIEITLQGNNNELINALQNLPLGGNLMDQFATNDRHSNL